jgi:hypothetical protein
LKFDVYQDRHFDVNFKPLSINRDWMDATFERHAYKCFPISLANMVGWTFSYPEDISFIWDGNPDSSPNHVKVLSGKKYVFTDRSNATISFRSGLNFKTDEDISLMLMPVPNQFIEGVQGFTNIISPSVLKVPIPYAWKITKADTVITIPAGTPIVSIIPVSLLSLQEVSMNLHYAEYDEDYNREIKEYGDASLLKAQSEKWTNFYRDAVDHKGKTIGKHEVKSLRLSLNDFRR